MNDKYLPTKTLDALPTCSIEDYQKPFFDTIGDDQQEILWIIQYIRKTLMKTRFHSSSFVDEQLKRKLQAIREERRNQLDILRMCETNIKKSTNSLLNIIAESTNQEWNDYELAHIIGFTLKGTNSSEKRIPLSIQSRTYMLLHLFCLLWRRQILSG